MLHLVNSSSGGTRDFHWCIIVCHMSGWRVRLDVVIALLLFITLPTITTCLSPSVSLVFHFSGPTLDFPPVHSQWPSDLVLPLFFFLPLPVHPCLHVSLPSYGVYHAKAPRQCVSNYMFLLEALVSCVASPFASVARLGLDQRPRSRMATPPTVQDCHYDAGLGLWQTAVTLGMTRTHLSDLCVWPVLSQQQAVLPSTCPDHRKKWNVCAQQRVPGWGILVGRVCSGTLGHPFSSDGCSFKSHIFMETDCVVPKQPWQWRPAKGQMLDMRP